MNIQTLKAGVKKELWEFHKTLVWLPIVVAAMIVVFPLLQLFALEDYQWNRILMSLNELSQETITDKIAFEMEMSSFGFVGGLFLPFIAISLIVQLYYFTSCLFDERRDLSVYFWRSLPVSDVQTIGTKLVTGGLVIPIVFMVAATVTLIVAVFIGVSFSAFLASNHGISLWELWGHIQLLPGLASIWASLLPYFLWMLPVYAWLMLASMFARKAPFLWAVLPVVVIVIVELTVAEIFNTHTYYLIPVIGEYFAISEEIIKDVVVTGGNVAMLPLTIISKKISIAGLLVAAGLLYLTYWLRVNRSHG